MAVSAAEALSGMEKGGAGIREVVLPVGISFSGKLHFRSRITVRFGAPFSIPQTDPENPAPAVLKQVRQEMTKRVSALLPAPPEALPMQEDASAQKGELKS